jgi:hypothetical protein
MDLLDITCKFGEDVGKLCAKRVVKTLSTMNEPLLSGDDSGLENMWEEVCVQVQLQHSFYWDTYAEMMEGMVEHEVSKLKPHQLKAAWLCTEPGSEWRFTDEEEREDPCADPEEVAHWVYTEHLMSMADNFKNDRIQEYLDNSSLD